MTILTPEVWKTVKAFEDQIKVNGKKKQAMQVGMWLGVCGVSHGLSVAGESSVCTM